MKTFSYTKSQYLTSELQKIDELRKELLLIPFSLKDKQILRWNTNIDRIYYSLLLSGMIIEKDQVIEMLHPAQDGKRTREYREIAHFKEVLDHIYQRWLANTEALHAQDLIEIYEILYKTRLKIDTDELESSLRYVQANPDNPIVQSALAEILILANAFFGKETPQMAEITGLIFLYKNGYDFRRMLVIREYYYKFKDRYNNLIAQSLRDLNVTPWIEFVVDAVEQQLKTLLRIINSRDYQDVGDIFSWNINERQQSILIYLEKPGSKISNKIVQKLFKVSPITAARDLTRLATISLIFPFGKGRSTYYTKV